jgi:peptide/nickel transport system ATP-binding protein
MLKVDHLNVTFVTHHAVRGVSFEVKPGETVGIVGESGSGKTTAMQAICGLLTDATISGAISFEGVNPKTQLGKKIGLIFQSPMSSLNPTMKIGNQIAEGLIYHKIATKKQALKRAHELLELVGIPAYRAVHYPHQFSGGQRQRIAIAIALACNPTLLIADEPTTALDSIVQNQILTFIQEIQRKLQMSLILISHDLKLVSQICDSMIVFYQGKIVEQGKTSEIIQSPRHPYTQALLDSRNTFSRENKTLSQPWIEIQNISKSYGQFKALEEVSLTIKKGELLALVGQSGSGKSTLAKILLNLIVPDSGKIEVQGNQKRFQMIFQDPTSSLDPRMCVEKILTEPTEVYNLPNRVDELLSLVALPISMKKRYPHELSGGQRQRIGIARALALNPELLVCDEPVSSLDLMIQSQIIKLLLKLKQELKLTLLFISHDLPLVSAIADRIAVMKDGKIVEIIENESIQDLYTKQLYQSQEIIPIPGNNCLGLV